MNVDLLLRGGRVIDGTGRPAERADVAVTGGKIVRTGPGLDVNAHRTLDLGGLVVTPGFIDMHSHSDYTFFHAPEAESRIGQGITTEVVGNCGYSPAPLNPVFRAGTMEWSGSLAQGLDFSWQGLGSYLDRVEANGVATNVLALVGHGAIRVAAMGFDRREPRPDELETMRRLTAEAMTDGAYGLSTGLVYPPATYSSTEEVIAVAEVAGRYGGLYFTHMRDEADGLFDAIRETLRIGREAHLPVQISHLKAAGRKQWGRMGEVLGLLEEARAAGQDVAADFYPYEAGSTFLYGILPPFLMDGGIPALMVRLGQAETRQRVADAIAQGIPGWWNPVGAMGTWDVVTVTDVGSQRNRDLMGLTVPDIARRRGTDPVAAALRLLEEERGAVHIVIRMMQEDDTATTARAPFVMMGTDGAAECVREASEHLTHPRSYGTTAKWLSTYVRERSTSTVEEAVHRMTGLPARRMGLRDRGTIAPGQAADLVVLDPARVDDLATYAEPHRPPTGFVHVLVNGELALKDGHFTGARAGRVLRHRA